jgi:hypothetical protein
MMPSHYLMQPFFASSNPSKNRLAFARAFYWIAPLHLKQKNIEEPKAALTWQSLREESR